MADDLHPLARWEKTSDGETWETNFDAVYRKVDAQASLDVDHRPCP